MTHPRVSIGRGANSTTLMLYHLRKKIQEEGGQILGLMEEMMFTAVHDYQKVKLSIE